MSGFEELMKKKAVALKYDAQKNGAPVIVASGMGYMAEKITEAAMEAGVPVYEDDSLATLLSQMKLGAAIPQELYQAVVDIYIYFLGVVPEEVPEAQERSGIPTQDDSKERIEGGTADAKQVD